MSSDSFRRATDEQINAAWIKVCEKADEWVKRSGNEGGFTSPQPGSSLAGDDARSAGYLVSHAVQHNLSQSIDCVHAVVSLVRNLGVLHPAALGNLLRGALETTSVALWVLSPPQRQERLARTLRWHVKNIEDGETAFTGAGISRSSTGPNASNASRWSSRAQASTGATSRAVVRAPRRSRRRNPSSGTRSG